MEDSYSKIGHIEILNEYLSNLKVLNNNLYNLHFNVIGEHFFTLHKKLEDYYKETAEMYDTMAERIKMLDQYPITSLVQYEEKSTIKSMRSQDFTTKQTYNILINDFNFMLSFSKELEVYASKINDYVTGNLMNENILFFEKELWMLTASNK